MDISLGELAVRFGCSLGGDPQVRISRVGSLAGADAACISFLANPKLRRQLAGTAAGAVVLDEGSASHCPVPYLVARNPHATFARIASLLYPLPPLRPGIHPSAVVEAGAQVDPTAEVGALCFIAASARVGPGCRLGPGCTLGAGVELGTGVVLVARVSLEHGVQVGDRTMIHPGVVIGADGFGLAREGAGWLKVPQIGRVIIGMDVEIGANTTIDRGAIGDTVIGDGVKLDNQIQVAHNVHIGAHTAIAGCTGIAGSTRIGERCMIGGATAINGHLEICNDVVITGMSMVVRSIRTPGIYSGGLPAEPSRDWRRTVAQLRRMMASAKKTASASQQDEDDEH